MTKINKAKGDKAADLLFRKYETILFVQMNSTYQVKTRKVIAVSVGSIKRGSGAVKQSEINRVIKIIDKALNEPFTPAEISKINKTISRHYVEDKALASKRFKLKPTDSKSEKINKADIPELGAAFDLDDKHFVEGIQAQNAIAAQSIYSRSYSAAVVDAVNTTLKTPGLSRNEIGKALGEQLAKTLGLKPNAAGSLVAPGFKGTSDQYFSGLSTTTINRSMNYNHIALFKQADVARYKISAILDRRTSEICLSMDGRIFTVEQAIKTIETVISSGSSEELAEAVPWRRNLEEFGLEPGKKTGSVKTAASLADAGMALPPYHFRCRTQVIPI